MQEFPSSTGSASPDERRHDIAKRDRANHAQHRYAPGALKNWIVLNREGIRCGKHRVARLRKLENIEAHRKSRFRVMQTHKNSEPPAADLVKRAFIVDNPNQVSIGVMTALRTREGWLHLAIVLDHGLWINQLPCSACQTRFATDYESSGKLS